MNYKATKAYSVSSDKNVDTYAKVGTCMIGQRVNTTEKYHIYDIAGNLWEWTEEDSHYQTSGQYRVCRGGSLWDTSSDRPACYRLGNCTTSWTSASIGFRAVLYIK